jgi:DNA-binding phage protein
MTNRLLNAQDVLRRLRREVKQAGGQSEWARRMGVDRTLLNKVLQGRRHPGPQIIRALELKKVVNCVAPEGNDLLHLLRQAIERTGSIAAWSRRSGIDRAFASRVVNGKKPPSMAFFRALKVKNVTAYIAQEGETEE